VSPALSGLCPDRLALRAQAGDATALELLLVAFRPLLGAAARDFRIPSTETADREQVGRLALLSAVRHYDAARGPFAALAKRSVRNRLANLLEHAARPCRQPSGTVVSLDLWAEDPEEAEPLGLAPSAEELAVDRLHAQAVRQAAEARAADRVERLLLVGIQRGASLAELATEAGMTPQALGRRRERLLARLRSELTGAGYTA
jgi:RNA polymerase sigma factor (sigma-70 family)